ncbi:GNAT family N-acetyltransferase [Saccharopolyspora phatthalungensis]|uniref:Ribosomal protein S18 acetylase RimI-like enzyme n=1 Tax=Saccharopolyspora phatthalungensis TaxID=664693 RepID=A0A840Q2Q5_9PSEU|nr:GNAT family N-acetyltransferase [Saccharopolyspora phatthalungensis]MBB5152999.1 ribosomal protein S18 acetylase RimI-like enzyme [Saccharopolyspora phatthalungensis]
MHTTKRDDLVLRTAGSEDTPTLAELLSAAYRDDPRMSALLPDHAHRETKLHALFSLLLTQEHLDHGTEIAVLNGQPEAVAVWDRPGSQVVPLGRRLAYLPALLSVFRWRLPEATRAIQAFNATDSHRPDEPHWHLAAIGTTPHARSRGLGRALLDSGLARADAHDTPVYLEATTHAGVTHFERFGFRVIHEYPIAAGLTVYGMWRPVER